MMIGGIGALGPSFLSGLGSTPLAGGSTGAGAASTTSFASALGEVADNAVGKLQSAEQMSMKALSGDADTREVVDAVMSAEQTLQAAIAIRDKIVTAYLEVSRMAI